MPNENGSFKNKMSSLWAMIKKYAAKVWAYLKVAKMEYIVMISIFAVDLISKSIVNATTAVGDTVVLIPNFLQIHNVHNYAAAFGSDVIKKALGSVGSRIFFSIFAVAASVMFIFVLIRCRKQHRVIRISLALLVAGAMGNCIDRMALGYVRDFVEFVYFGLTILGSKSFYVFNIADAALVIGVVLAIVYFLFLYKDRDDAHKEGSEDLQDADGDRQAADVNGGDVSEETQDVVNDEQARSDADGAEDGAKECDADGFTERVTDETEESASDDNVREVSTEATDDTADGVGISFDNYGTDDDGSDVVGEASAPQTRTRKRSAVKSDKKRPDKKG